VDQGEDEQAIGARRNTNPFVCDRIVARAYRVHANDFSTALFQAAQAHFNRVGIVILSNAKNHEHFGAFPIGLTKFPKGTTHGVNARCGHIHRTKSAVCGIVWRAKLLRPKASKGLGLVASREEGQLFRVFVPDRLEPTRRHVQRLVPRNFFKLTRTPRAGAQQRRAQAGGRLVLHDASTALGTENTLIHRVVTVALDIGNLTIAHVNVNAAATGAHVAGGFANLV